MTRPLHIWIVFGLALVILLLATAWVSVAVWRLDEAQFHNQLRADEEEKVRLALWRMDSFMSPLIVEEAARPRYHYQPFHSPERAYTRTMAALEEIMVPSPLLDFTSSNVVLHFQMDARGRLTSPQVPEGRGRQLALGGQSSSNRLAAFAARLETLRELLGATVEEPRAQTIARAVPRAPLRNRDILLLTCGPFRTNVVPLFGVGSGSETVPAALSPGEEAPGALEPIQTRRRQEMQELTQSQESEPLANLKASAVADRGALKQRVLNVGEQAARANVYQEIVRKEGAAPPSRWSGEEGTIRPLWVGPELLLARRAVLDDGSYIQGAWLHWDHLRLALLHTIRDLFPQADLQPMTSPLGEIDSRMMASLPVELVTPQGPVVAMPVWTPLRVSLGVAWLCVLLAALAVAALLHGVVSLSERRADFVSSVTHELRTPLTTFRMYSEMLADDMVTDDKSRRQYLRTLCAESNRLSHLVENVLAYARLERGRAGERIERIALGRLLPAVQSRLEQRAAAGGMRIVLELAPEVAGAEVQTDAAAVEQILFNLVDNACKYAGPRAEDNAIRLKARLEGRRALVRVQDQGAGLSAEALQRLFKPFSKSAREAAGDVPGVGLGLALCRRLSRGIGADLVYQSQPGAGATFVLILPLARAHA